MPTARPRWKSPAVTSSALGAFRGVAGEGCVMLNARMEKDSTSATVIATQRSHSMGKTHTT